MTKKEQAAQEAKQDQELILLVLAESEDLLTSSEIGKEIGVSGHLAGKYLAILLQERLIKRLGSGPGKYLYGKLDKKTSKPIPMSKRVMLAWKIDGRGFGDIFTSEKAAYERANEIAREHPDVVLFIGEAIDRICYELKITKCGGSS